MNVSIWLGLFGALFAWGFAIYVAIIARGTKAARLLIALLVVDGIYVFELARGLQPQSPELGSSLLASIYLASTWAMLFIYWPFLGVALNSRLVSWVQNSRVQLSILLVGGGLFPLWVAFTYFSPRLFNYGAGWVFFGYNLAIVFSFTWGLIAAVHTYMSARSVAKKNQALALVLAFGLRDFGIVFYYASILSLPLRTIPTVEDLGRFMGAVGSINLVTMLIYIPLLVYGMLKTQLFDIDLRIKKTLVRAIIATAFIAVFYAVSELAAVWLSDLLGNVIGLLCTGVLIVLIDPIQRVAKRASDVAMPNTESTPQYEAYRKLQVYEAAVETALQEGDVSDRERRMLESLIESLRIDPEAAERVESDLRSAR